MYIPKHFKEDDMATAEKLVREFSFATLISIAGEVAFATHIPLELKVDEAKNWILCGHIAKANPQWKNFENNPKVLAVFMGPHTYVSPSWYKEANVPTWNYLAVHVYGTVRILTTEELEPKLKKMMHHYESAHAEKPLRYEEIPGRIVHADLRALVGFEIKAERIEAASKLSQNRDGESFANIIEHLKKMQAYDAGRIAEEMEKRKK